MEGSATARKGSGKCSIGFETIHCFPTLCIGEDKFVGAKIVKAEFSDGLV